jgi:hypothetical protein
LIGKDAVAVALGGARCTFDRQRLWSRGANVLSRRVEYRFDLRDRQKVRPIMKSPFPWRVAFYGWGVVVLGTVLLGGLASLLDDAWLKFPTFYVALYPALSAIMFIKMAQYGIKATLLFVALSAAWVGLIFLILMRYVPLSPA